MSGFFTEGLAFFTKYDIMRREGTQVPLQQPKSPMGKEKQK